MKTCSKCNIEKSLSIFGKDRSRKDGYAHKCKLCAASVQKHWVTANKEKAKIATLKWRANNHDKVLETQRNNRRTKTKIMSIQNKQYYLCDPIKFIDRANQWKNNNRGAFLAIQAKRRATKLRATPAWADHAQIQMFYDLAAALNAMGEQKWHVDHIVPLQSTLVCGLHCEANLCVVTATENISKSNRYWPDMPL